MTMKAGTVNTLEAPHMVIADTHGGDGLQAVGAARAELGRLAALAADQVVGHSKKGRAGSSHTALAAQPGG